MTYQLKPGVESFEVVDGPMARRKFLRGKAYAEIPPGDKGKFEKIITGGQPATQPADKKSDVDKGQSTIDNQQSTIQKPEVKP